MPERGVPSKATEAQGSKDPDVELELGGLPLPGQLQLSRGTC